MKELANRLHALTERFDFEPRIAVGEGCSTSQLEQFEKAVGAEMPSDFRALYRQINGTKLGAIVSHPDLLSLQESLDCLSMWRDIIDPEFNSAKTEPDGGINTDWYSPMWVPITDDGCGNHICVDLNPTDAGTRGQIIEMWHDDPERRLLASSLGHWLGKYISQIEAGDFELMEAEEDRPSGWRDPRAEMTEKERGRVLAPQALSWAPYLSRAEMLQLTRAWARQLADDNNFVEKVWLVGEHACGEASYMRPAEIAVVLTIPDAEQISRDEIAAEDVLHRGDGTGLLLLDVHRCLRKDAPEEARAENAILLYPEAT